VTEPIPGAGVPRDAFDAALKVTTTHVATDGERVHLILDPVGGEPTSAVYSPDEAKELGELLISAASNLPQGRRP
jgi:hypothetical protein